MGFQDTTHISTEDREYLAIIHSHFSHTRVTFITRNGFITTSIGELPFPVPPQNITPTEKELTQLFPDTKCSLCDNTATHLEKFKSYSLKRLPQSITLSERPIEVTNTSGSQYLCSECVKHFNETAQTLLEQNSHNIVIEKI